METQGDLEETWFLLFCSCGQMKTAWMGEGLGWVIKNTTARQHQPHCGARGAQCFILQSSVSTDLYICEINLLTHKQWGWGFSLIEINKNSEIDLFGGKADLRDLSMSPVHQSKEGHFLISYGAQCSGAACALLMWGHGFAEHFLSLLTTPFAKSRTEKNWLCKPFSCR